jgi:hypothetical protein
MDGTREHEGASSPPMPLETQGKNPPWEQIEKGRYMPRRIRGSFLGRELG